MEDTQVEVSNGKDWNLEELRATIVAYREMQRLEREGKKYAKKSYYLELAKRFGRTTKAFEYRMENISYVMSLMGRSDWLTGLKPAKNVGANVGAKIEKLIAEVEGKNATPVVAFEIQVREEREKKGLEQPEGCKSPKASTAIVTQYARDRVLEGSRFSSWAFRVLSLRFRDWRREQEVWRRKLALVHGVDTEGEDGGKGESAADHLDRSIQGGTYRSHGVWRSTPGAIPVPQKFGKRELQRRRANIALEMRWAGAGNVEIAALLSLGKKKAVKPSSVPAMLSRWNRQQIYFDNLYRR